MANKLALYGGRPVRHTVLPYGQQWVSDADVQAVAEVLRSPWLTTGPRIAAFEQAFAEATDVAHAIAVSSGTAALHGAMHALGLGPGDEVIVPPLTFAATANAVLLQGAMPVFADVDPDTLLIDPARVETSISERTRAIVAVDYAGQTCDYAALQGIASQHGLHLAADACHALGGTEQGRRVGSLAEINTFSLHPVKPITAGEGGVITTNDDDLATRCRRFRNHGINADHHQRERSETWYYEMVELGHNHRLSDIHCALALSQLHRLPAWVERRREIAARYDAAFAGEPSIEPLKRRDETGHAYHLYVVRLDTGALRTDRATVFRALRAEGIGVNVHYIPVHLHPYYRRMLGTSPGLCPVAEAAYNQILTLPLFPRMREADVTDVVEAVHKIASYFAR